MDTAISKRTGRARIGVTVLTFALCVAGCSDEGDDGGESTGATKASKPPADIVAQIPGRPPTKEAQAPGTYVGAAGKKRNPAVAFVVKGDRVVVYVCDGKKLGDWFAGPVEGGRFELESKTGTRIRGTVTPKRVEGTLVLAGGPGLAYAAAPPARDRPHIGLFAFDDPSSKGFKARWIVTRYGLRGISLNTTGVGTNGVTVTQTKQGTQADTRFSGVNSGIQTLLTSTQKLKAELIAARDEDTSLRDKLK